MSRLVAVIFCFILLAAPASAHAAEGGHHTPAPPAQDWSFDGFFGTYDRAALQRGYKVYSQVCAACHSMDRVYFRNLVDLGYTDAQVKAIAANYTVTDGPNDEGDMFERPARPSDRFPNPYPNRQAAGYANNGAVPPDMSLLAKARANGSDYIVGIMTGYEEPPEDAHLLPGQYWNQYMPGHVIAMAPPLSPGLVAYEDGSPETVIQYAKDVSHFLTWAAEPNMEKRKRTGLKVFLFLLVFTAVAYAVKRKIWADQH